MQQVAVHAKKEVSEYLGKVENHFVEDTFSVAETMAVMENYLQEWYVFHLIGFTSQLQASKYTRMNFLINMMLK